MSRHRARARVFRALTLSTAGLLAALARPSAALNIVFTPLSANTNPNISGFTADLNAQDITGNGLLTVLNHVGDAFERVIDDPGTVEITYWWDDMTIIGQSSPSWIVESGNQVTMSGVRFNADLLNAFGLNWFIDPTPASDTEFDMQQTLFRDLSGTAQTARYQGATPDLFEAAFSGSANANAPASTFMDLVTVAFQEVGHALGMNAGFSNVSNGSNTGEGDDFKFDIPTAWVNGDSMDILARGFSNPGAGDGKDHIVGNNVVMGGVNADQRNRPSAADILAIAVTGNYDDPDLPRKDFLGGVQWDNGFNWLGGAAPDLDDEVFIRHGTQSSVVLDEAGLTVISDLTVDGGSRLSISNTALLLVLDDVVVQRTDAGPASSGITVNADSELDAVDLRINDGGLVSVFDGLIDAEQLRIGVGGGINGNGIVRFEDVMRNDGEIAATRPFGIGISTLFINSVNGNTIDLDGNTGDGVLTADFADVSLTATLADAFNGTMNIGEGHFINMVQPWTLGGSGGQQDGVIDLDGGNADADRARLTGGALTVDGGQINASGFAHLNVAVTVLNESNIIVNNGANLEFNGTTTLDGGTYTVGANANLEFDGATTVDTADFVIDPDGVVSFDGPTTYSFNTAITSTGLIQQTGDATVIGAMSVNGGTFDLDGVTGSTVIDLGNSANPGTMTLNVDAIDEVVNRFDGTINTAEAGLVGGLTVNLPGNDSWTMDGTLNLETSNILISNPVRIAGSKMEVTGTVNVANGSTRITADVDLLTTSTVNTAAVGAELHLDGVTRVFDGAAFTGNGLLVNRSGGDLTLRDEVSLSIVGVENSGQMRIGDAPGDIGDAFLNRFTQTSTGVLHAQLAGPTIPFAIDQPYDRLTVRANAALAGNLDLALVSGYDPVLYDSHTILFTQLGTVSGAFDYIAGAPYAPGRMLAVTYTSTSVVITASLAGDLDLDGDVDDADFGLAFAAFTGPNAGPTSNVNADLDGDGDVDDADFGLAFANFTGPGGPANVPEPASMALFALGGLIACRRRR